jgi:hypothetical protein
MPDAAALAVTAPASGAPAVARTAPRRRRDAIGRAAVWLLPGALALFFGFWDGGFFADAVGIGALVCCGALLLRITGADAPAGGLSRWGAVAGTALAGFALLTLISAWWSDAPARATIEYTRALLYLLVFGLVAAVPRGPGGVRWVLHGIGVGLALVALGGLATRLWPGALDVELGGSRDRLAWPVGYWNVQGLAAGMALLVALWATSDTRERPWVRALAAAAVPALAVAGYLTLSRGAIVATVVGVALFVALGRPRGMVTALVAVVPLGAVAVLAAYDAQALVQAFDPASAAARAAGGELAGVLAWTCLAAAALRALLTLADHRLARVRVPRPSRGARIAALALVAVALAGAFLALDGPTRVSDQWRAFNAPDMAEPSGDIRDRLGAINSRGRVDHWRVALDAWEREPLRGTGAGTFAKLWDGSPRANFEAQDAHSLYLEALAELGVVGLGLLAAALLTGLAALAWRRREDRVRWSAALAVALMWAAHAGGDWDWEMPVVTVAAVGLLGAGCARATGRPPGRLIAVRPVRILTGLLALLLAVTPFQVMRSQQLTSDAVARFADRDCAGAARLALVALEALNSRTEPFQLLAYCDVRAGQSRLAVQMLQAALRRDPGNWQLLYGLGLARATAGQDPRPALRAARRAAPREPLVQDALARMRGDRPRRWDREARRSRLALSPVPRSGPS